MYNNEINVIIYFKYSNNRLPAKLKMTKKIINNTKIKIKINFFINIT